MPGTYATDLRKLLAGQAQIKDVKFWAVRASTQEPQRRLAMYAGIGVDGAVTEDLGQDAGIEVLEAIVDEDVYNKLYVIKHEAKVVTIVHPLFGVFEGRLANITYDAGPADMLNIVCTCIKHGDPAGLFVASANTTAQNKATANSAYDDLSTPTGDNMTLSDLGDFDISTGLPAASTNFASAFGTFSAIMDTVAAANGLWTDAAAAFTEFAESAGDLIDVIDDFADATQEMVDMVDKTYYLLDVARDWVDSVERQASTVWHPFKVRNPLSLAEIALSIVGDDSEDVIDAILNRNPTLVDICAIPPGVELSIPVTL